MLRPIRPVPRWPPGERGPAGRRDCM